MTAINLPMFSSTWIVYRVHAPQIDPARPFFIGACTIRDFADLADAWTWNGWNAHVNDTIAIKVSVVALYSDEATALAVQHATAVIERVWINLNDTRCDPPPKNGARGSRAVVEPATGREWPNAAALARELGKTPQAVSLHLRGSSAHVGGRKFDYKEKDA